MANRFLVGAALAFVTFIAGNTAHAQDYPTRPITAVIPFAGGSASDVVSRILFDKMSKSLGPPIVVENRPGAGGNIGTADVARATPDGYTLLSAATSTYAINPNLMKDPLFDQLKDLVPFGTFGRSPWLLGVQPNSPFHSVADERLVFQPASPSWPTVTAAGDGSIVMVQRSLMCNWPAL